MNILLEFLFPHPSTLMHSNSKGTLRNQNIDIRLRNLSLHNVPILFTAIVASIKHFDSINFNDKHSCSDNMPSYIWSKFNPFLLSLYSKLDRIDSFETVQDFLGVEECLILLHLGSISDQIMIDILRGFSHKYLLLEIRIMSKKEWQSSAMIEMGMGDQYQR